MSYGFLFNNLHTLFSLVIIVLSTIFFSGCKWKYVYIGHTGSVEYGVQNNYVFITKQGGVISISPTHNNIQKRLNKYSKEFGLRNINPHALRRGFAKSLLNKGANIAEISKAVGHSNLAVTTQYLHLDKEEVGENLRKYL